MQINLSYMLTDKIVGIHIRECFNNWVFVQNWLFQFNSFFKNQLKWYYSIIWTELQFQFNIFVSNQIIEQYK
jgi:hypothetical protein